MNKAGEWSQEDLNYAIENRNNMSYVEIGKALGRTRNAVMIKLNKMGYKLNPINVFDSSFFKKIDTESKAYWLGFIYADGYISYSKSNKQTSYTLGIELNSIDHSHLELFNHCISGNLMIKNRTKKFSKLSTKESEMSLIRVYSKEMVEDLISHGVVYKKSNVIEFPKLKKELVRHFIRGFFDGDGSISIEKEKQQLRCNFTCGSKVFVDRIKSILDKMGLSTYISKERNHFRLGINGKKSNKIFLEYIYDDSTIYLERKHNFYFANAYLLDYIYEGWNNR